MKIGEIVAVTFAISALFLLLGIVHGSNMQEAKTNTVLKDLGYRLEHHQYVFDNVSSNWYELVQIKDAKRDGDK